MHADNGRMAPLRILLIDDHTLFRSGLRLIIESRFPGAQVLEAGSLEQVLQADLPPADVVLLDICLPGLSGLDSIFLLRKRLGSVPIVMLSSDASNSTVQQALERGAAGFVSKAEKPEAIAAAILSCLNLNNAFVSANPPTAPASTLVPMPAPELTSRQREVLELLGRGLPNKTIGRQLDISENTVRGHVQSLLVVLNASSRSEAVYMARQRGLLA